MPQPPPFTSATSFVVAGSRGFITYRSVSVPLRLVELNAISSPSWLHESNPLRLLPSVSIFSLPSCIVYSWKNSLPPMSLPVTNTSPFTGAQPPPPTGSASKLICLRAPIGIATRCSCAVLPNRVAITIDLSVGCQPTKLAVRNSI